MGCKRPNFFVPILTSTKKACVDRNRYSELFCIALVASTNVHILLVLQSNALQTARCGSPGELHGVVTTEGTSKHKACMNNIEYFVTCGHRDVFFTEKKHHRV